MADTYKFSRIPILGWALDEKQRIIDSIASIDSTFDLDDAINEFREDKFQNKIEPILQECGMKLNLGGETEKDKIIITDKPSGIFDFSLASKGLYRLQEFYSEEIATNYPDKFKSSNLPIGVVPIDFVNSRVVAGETEYFYKDNDGVFILKKQQKGEQAIKDGVKGARLGFATKTKKSFVTFKRNRGKVKYLEIYSLFYFTNLSGAVQFAIRQLPILMLAKYFESIGIKTRIYMTRFVLLNPKIGDRKGYRLKKENGGVKLPMYEKYVDAEGTDESYAGKLFVQPIIVKDFGEELDETTAFAISTDSWGSNSIYNKIASSVQQNEIEVIPPTGIITMGEPRWEKDDYYVGFERYRNKYQEYVKSGVFKSKEVLPEAMIFFHDYIIKENLAEFLGEARNVLRREIFNNQSTPSETEALTNIEINPFFSWWMRLSANNVKVRVNLVNSLELEKDLEEMRRDLERLYEEGNKIINDSKNTKIRGFLIEYRDILFTDYKITDYSLRINFRNFILNILNEITIYAEGGLYPSTEEYMEKMDDLDSRINEALQKMTF